MLGMYSPRASLPYSAAGVKTIFTHRSVMLVSERKKGPALLLLGK